MKQETKCIQAGYEPGNGESRMIPIIQSTTFKYDSSEAMGRLLIWKRADIFIHVCKIRPMIRWLRKSVRWKVVRQRC